MHSSNFRTIGRNNTSDARVEPDPACGWAAHSQKRWAQSVWTCEIVTKNQGSQI